MFAAKAALGCEKHNAEMVKFARNAGPFVPLNLYAHLVFTKIKGVSCTTTIRFVFLLRCTEYLGVTCFGCYAILVYADEPNSDR